MSYSGDLDPVRWSPEPSSSGPRVLTLHIGKVLGRSFTVLFRNIVAFWSLALAFTAPIYLIAIAARFLVEAGWRFGEMTTWLITGFVFVVVVLNYLLIGAVTAGVNRVLRGERCTIAGCFRRGIPAAAKAGGVATLYGALAVAGLIIIIVTSAIFAPQLGFVAVPRRLIVVLALVIFPGLVIVSVYWVAAPAAAVERLGMFRGFSRSAALTKGNRWRVFVLAFVVLVLAILLSITGGLLSLSFNLALSRVTGSDVIVDWVFWSLTAASWSVVSAVTYHDLRVAKEGADPDQLAAVFD